MTFTENFRSIGLTEEAPDEFCRRAGEGQGTEGGYIGRSGGNFIYKDSWTPPHPPSSKLCEIRNKAFLKTLRKKSIKVIQNLHF